MTKVLYIAGYGRSGSTVLSIILGNHREVINVGELSLLLNDLANHDRQCSCRVPYRECDFWKDLILDQPPAPELTQLVRKVERLSFLPRLLLGMVTNKDRLIYRVYQEKLFKYIVSRSGSSIVVDASKSARGTVGRFLALIRLAGEDVYVLHLVRNGLAAMESTVITGSNWAIEGYTEPRKWPVLRTPLGWVSANAWASGIGLLLGPQRYMLLLFEDFLADPATALRKVGQFLDLDTEDLIKRIDRNDYFQVGHIVGGNRVRLQGDIRLERGSKHRYGDRLKPNQRLIFTLLGGWLNHWYGYGGG